MKFYKSKKKYIVLSAVIFALLLSVLIWQLNLSSLKNTVKVEQVSSNAQIVYLDEDYNNRDAHLTEEELTELTYKQLSSQIKTSIVGMDKVFASNVKIYVENDETFADVKIYAYPTNSLSDTELENIQLFVEGSLDISQSNINIKVVQPFKKLVDLF